MRVAVTGTPGTGKTTATELLAERLEAGTGGSDGPVGGGDSGPDTGRPREVIHVNRLVEDEGLHTDVDEDRDSVVADLEALADRLESRDDVVLESHLAHHLDADRVAVLRCHPEALEDRLLERGEPEAKASENAESEALDVILSEAVERHGLESVYEIDTTEREPSAVADALEAVIDGTREPSAGEVDFLAYR